MNPAHEEFVERFLKHQRQVYAYIVRLLPYGDAADEVFQQTNLVLWKKWAEFRSQPDFLRLACNVAFNEMRNYLRREDRRCKSLTEEVIDALSQTQHQRHEEASLRSKALTGCIEKLPPRQRSLLEQAYAGNQTTCKIASEMGVTADSLYMRLHRIRRSLLQCIDLAVSATEQT